MHPCLGDRGAPAGPPRGAPRRAHPVHALAALPRLLALGALVAVLGAAQCLPPPPAIPLDRPVFPTGLALAGDRLLVVSSDFDGAFGEGALLAANLGRVREATKTGDGNVVVRGAYEDGIVIPPFGEKPVVTSDGRHAYVPTRRLNILASVDIEADGAFFCGEDVDRCDGAPFALQLVENDPFDVVITAEARDGDALVRAEGIITSLASSKITFFSDDRRREGASRIQRSGELDLGADIFGVRAAVLRPEVAGTDAVVLAAADLSRTTSALGSVLVVFTPSTRSAIARFDVTGATGSTSMRDLVLVPGESGEAGALVAILRGPDAVARFDIDDDGGLPSLRLTALAPTCASPVKLAYARIPLGDEASGDGVDRVLITCQGGDVIEAIDPLSLRATDAVRFLGRSPYDVVVHTAVSPPEAYVSFFLDNSVGVLHLVDDDGAPRLVVRGRIGEAAPRPEDGRE
jgi:hypothetical protein